MRDGLARLGDLFDARHAFFSRRPLHRARRVHSVSLVLTRRLTVGATGSVDRINDSDVLLLVRANLEVHLAVAKREEGEIFTGADTVTRVEL